MKVTERAVVSVGTVSRVLSNDIRVAPDARGMVDGLLLIPLSNPADYIGTRTNTSFPLVSIDHQCTGRLCLDVGTRYGMPAVAYPFALEGMQGRHACQIYV